MQTNYFKVLLRGLVIGLLVVFVLAISGMILYPYQGKVQSVAYHLQSVKNGDYIYYHAFRWYATFIEPQAAEELTMSAQEVLPLEHNVDVSQGYSDLAERNKTSLSVPSVNINGAVVSGQSADSMNRGFWHYPGSGLPGNQQKIVIIGHRYLQVPPAQNTFYNLDKVQVGAKVYVSSELGKWGYTVVATRIVDRHDTSILRDTAKEQLILITCHPLWTSQQRLVIIAKPDLDNQYI